MSDSGPLSRVSRVHPNVTEQDVLVGIWMVGTVVAYYHNFLFVQSTALSYLYAFVFYGIGLVYAIFDERVRHLIVMGTIGGFLELLGDHFLVHTAGTLVYPTGYPFLLSSPAYMPFAWALLITFMGYVGIRLFEEISNTAAYIGPAIFAFVAETGYESLASQGGGWIYTTAPLGWIGHAPLFIVIAEAVMFASSYYWAKQDPLTGGLGIGITINLSYVSIYYLFVLVSNLS